jgi:ABC-type uncharacterized transport system substrate-binding protein
MRGTSSSDDKLADDLGNAIEGTRISGRRSGWAELTSTANTTDVNLMLNQMEFKRLSLLRELVPKANLIAVLFNPSSTIFDNLLADVQTAARAVGQQIVVLKAANAKEIWN